MSLRVDPEARALIVDLDGTLLDTKDAHFLAWRESLDDLGVELRREQFDRFWGRTTEDVLARLGENGTVIDAARFSMAKDQAYVRHVPRISPFPITLALVEAHSGQMPIAAATNEGIGVANIVLRGTGLAHLFTTLVTADDVNEPKPAPDIFLEAAARLGVPVGQCQVLEDSDVGIEAARRAGAIATDVRPFLG